MAWSRPTAPRPATPPTIRTSRRSHLQVHYNSSFPILLLLLLLPPLLGLLLRLVLSILLVLPCPPRPPRPPIPPIPARPAITATVLTTSPPTELGTLEPSLDVAAATSRCACSIWDRVDQLGPPNSVQIVQNLQIGQGPAGTGRGACAEFALESAALVKTNPTRVALHCPLPCYTLLSRSNNVS